MDRYIVTYRATLDADDPDDAITKALGDPDGNWEAELINPEIARTIITLDGSGKMIDRLTIYGDGAQNHWTARRILFDPENAAEPFTYADNVPAESYADNVLAEHLRGAEDAGDDFDPDLYVRSDCGCGYELIFTEEGWQHDAAPYFWGNDHDPQPDPDAIRQARIWEVEHCEHRPDDLPEPGDRCKDCGVPLTWTGPGMGDYEPAMGWDDNWLDDDLKDCGS